jgi:hypothetical protein
VNWAEGRNDRGMRYVLHGGPASGTHLCYWKEYERVAFAPDGKAVVGAGQAGVRAWDAATGQVVGPVPAPPPDEVLARGYTHTVAGSPGGGSVAVAVSVNEVYRQPGGEADVILTGRVALRVYDLRTGRLKHDVGQFDTIDRVAFMPDGRRLLVVRHGYAEVIDPDAPRRP